MNEIEIGEYVRTKDGIIAKVDDICNGYVFTDNGILSIEEKEDTNETIENAFEDINYIKKHSKNILKVLEKEDYINGHKIKEIYDGNYNNIKFGEDDLTLCYDFNNDTYHLSTNEIKSILTHDQYEKYSYKLEE